MTPSHPTRGAQCCVLPRCSASCLVWRNDSFSFRSRRHFARRRFFALFLRLLFLLFQLSLPLFVLIVGFQFRAPAGGRVTDDTSPGRFRNQCFDPGALARLLSPRCCRRYCAKASGVASTANAVGRYSPRCPGNPTKKAAL